MDVLLWELIGQRMVVGFPGTEIDDELKDLICNYKIGNIILFRHNIESIPQLKKLCSDLQQMVKYHTGHEAFIAIDQEGGMVTRLGQDAVNMPGAMAIAATGKVENAYEAGRITGEQLRSLGVNFNLAPTVDVNSNMDNPVIGVRSFGDKPDHVAEYAVAMTKGLLDGGVLACAKHFPGHGDTNVDSHLGLPLVDKGLDELEQCELIPFQKVIEAGIPAVMTTHILFPKIETRKIPATMSREIITGLLREKLGYSGLIVSDCMEMSAIKKYYGTVEGSIQAIKAGVDLIFISHTAKVAREVSEALVTLLDINDISMKEMKDSVERILKFKDKIMNDNSGGMEFDVTKGKNFASYLLKKSITSIQMPTKELPEIGPYPLFIGAPAIRATNVSNKQEEGIHFSEYMAKRLGGKAMPISANPSESDVLQALRNIENHSCIVIGTYNGHIYKGQLDLVNQVAKIHQKVIVIALRNPYDLKDLPRNVYGIAAYEYTKNSLEVVAGLLEHGFLPEGILPVKM
jgi:beta-N-acetylhexosaminidase